MGVPSSWVLLALAAVVCQYVEARNLGTDDIVPLVPIDPASSIDDNDDVVPLVPLEEIINNASRNPKQSNFLYDYEHRVVRTEYDMLYSVKDLERVHRNRQKRTAGIHPTDGWGETRWSNNRVPYEIVWKDFSDNDMGPIHESIRAWDFFTCLKLELDPNAANRVQIQNGDGCYSYVGMIGGAQALGLGNGCRYTRIVLHELGHAIGLHHEQTRPDRDDHVTLMKENISPAMLYNFQKYGWDTIMNLGINYDYDSIMHYSKSAFSTNGKATIRTKDPAYQDIIGKARKLSFWDIKTVNHMYQCSKSCNKKDSDCPKGGFVGKDCACWCPVESKRTSVQYCNAKDRATKGDLVPPKSHICFDRDTACEKWVAGGKISCGDEFMLDNCRKSCKLC